MSGKLRNSGRMPVVQPAVSFGRVGRWTTALALCACLGLAACRAISPVADAPEIGDAGPPPFATADVRLNLRAFAGPGAAGRATGTVGFGAVAAYAAERMREYGLQPVMPGEYRQLYFAPVHRVTDALLVRYGPDTTVVRTGPRLQPDARSAAGSVRSPRLWVVSPDTPVDGAAPAAIALMAPSDTVAARLRALREAGVRAAVVMGGSSAPAAASPVADLLLVHAPVDAVEFLVGGVPRAGTLLSADLEIEVAASSDPRAGALNVLAYLPGRDPVLRTELVIIGAALDGSGRPAEGSAADPGRAGTAAAAVLEAARVLAGMAATGEGPDRTVLVALWSGSHQGGAGVRSWIGNPTWLPSAVRRVVHVGGTSARHFREAGFPTLELGSDGVPAGEGSWLERGSAFSAALARRILVESSGDLWERRGNERVPAAPPGSIHIRP